MLQDFKTLSDHFGTLCIKGLRKMKKRKDILKDFDDFKNKQQKCMKEYFLICKCMYILKVYLIHYYTLR